MKGEKEEGKRKKEEEENKEKMRRFRIKKRWGLVELLTFDACLNEVTLGTNFRGFSFSSRFSSFVAFPLLTPLLSELHGMQNCYTSSASLACSSYERKKKKKASFCSRGSFPPSRSILISGAKTP